MKIFVPASTGSDSSYLLYRVLSDYDGEVVARIIRFDATIEDMENVRHVHAWLKSNVRDFDFRYAEYEEMVYEKQTIASKEHNYGLMANHHKCDLIITGHNTYNWSHSNWFFQSDDPIEKFYEKDMPYGRIAHYTLRDTWDGPIEWVFMNRKSKPIGRWEIWENLPSELKDIVYVCNCGSCIKCKLKKFYRKMKAEGYTAEQIDNEIQKKGKYGRYYCSETKVEERHSAYEMM